MEFSGTEFQILDTLARQTGGSPSIRSFTEKVDHYHGKAHYANVHKALQGLAEEGIVTFRASGRSKIPGLRFQNPGFLDAMATLELWRKRTLLKERPNASEPLKRLESSLAEKGSVLSVCLTEPDRNLRLRRLEPLILIQDTNSQPVPSQEADLAEEMAELQSATSLRIDPWIVPAQRFENYLRARQANPAPRILHTETCLWHPQAFWRTVATALPHGEGLAPQTRSRLASMEESALAWNLTRWGYEERGRELDDHGPRLCPEATVIAALAANVPRWTGAAGVVLAKANIDPTLLVYLAKSEDQAARLAALAEILQRHQPRPILEHTLTLLDALKIGAEPIEQGMVMETVELYGG